MLYSSENAAVNIKSLGVFTIGNAGLFPVAIALTSADPDA